MTILDCGTPLSRLSAYADLPPQERGTEMPSLDRHAEGCEHCQNVLASMDSVAKWAGVLRAETNDAPTDRKWASDLMSRLSLPVREGRTITIVDGAEQRLAVTEAVLRGLIRSRCSSEGIFVLGSKIRRGEEAGDEAAHDATDETTHPVQVACEVAVRYGCVIPSEVATLRERVFDLMREQTGLDVLAVNVDVIDVFKDDYGHAKA